MVPLNYDFICTCMVTHSILHVKCQVSHGNLYFHEMRRAIFMRCDVVLSLCECILAYYVATYVHHKTTNTVYLCLVPNVSYVSQEANTISTYACICTYISTQTVKQKLYKHIDVKLKSVLNLYLLWMDI